MRGEARSCDSSDWLAAVSARRVVRPWFAWSSARLRRRTATFTNTTPASSTALTAIQRMPPRARARDRFRAATSRRWVRGAAAVAAWLAVQLATLRRHPETCGLRARVARHLGGARPDRAPRGRAQLRLGAARADREIRRARTAVLLRAQEAL